MVVGIVGTGLMGQGIAQVAATAGLRVLLHDAREGAAAAARDAVGAQLRTLAGKGRIAAADAEAAVARLVPVPGLEHLAPCDLVIEAVVEDLDAKRAVFAALEAVVRDDCILATNTSSLSVTAIAAACAQPGRVAGMHFFSPVPLMKLVEVVDGERTRAGVSERLCAAARDWGHEPVRAADSPGFIVNHAGRGFGTEALRLLSEGIAAFHEIDDILREGAGFRMGPFELLDLTGLDVSQPVMDSIYRQYYDEPRFRPTPLLARRRAAGLLGRKTGEGFYRYVEGRRVPVGAAPAAGERPASAWLGPGDPQSRARVADLLERLGTPPETDPRPSEGALCVLLPWGTDATGAAVDAGLDASRCVAIDAWIGLDTWRTVMATPVTDARSRAAAAALFGADGVPVTLVRDSPGFVAPRVIAHIVNIACDLAQQRVASPADIERAVTLGLGYPRGPFAMGDAMGASQVLALLEGLQAFYGDPRYRASPWLRRRARLGVPLATPEP